MHILPQRPAFHNLFRINCIDPGNAFPMERLWEFYCYSFLGFLLELGFARATHAAKHDRKCHLFLPICPVYGLGAALILSLPPFIKQHPLLLALSAGALATGTEYALALFYEKVWHTAFWDYHTLPGNLHGRVCLPFSVIWGVLGVGLVYGASPLLAPVFRHLPPELLIPITLVFCVDAAVTGQVLRRSGTTEALRWYRE